MLNLHETERRFRTLQKSNVLVLRRIRSTAEQTSAILLPFLQLKHFDRVDFVSVMSPEPIKHLTPCVGEDKTATT